MKRDRRGRAVWAALFLLLSPFGCSGEDPPGATADGGPRASPGGAASASAGCAPASPRRLRRLTSAEFGAVLDQLFGDKIKIAVRFPGELKTGDVSSDADSLTVTGPQSEAYALAAEQAARQLPVATLAPCERPDDAAAARGCAATFARTFGQRAYGRPITDGEAGRLAALFDAGAQEGSYAEGVRLMAEAMLQSPHFLYRAELGPVESESAKAAVPLEPYEIASALSFLVTGARPDAALLAAAAAGRLAEAAGRVAEARRLLATPRARTHLRDFFLAWFGVEEIGRLAKANYIFGDFPAEVRADMDREVRRFIDLGVANGGSLTALLGGTNSFVTPRLASDIYGKDELLAAPAGPDRPTPLNPKLRRGLLSLPGFLSAHAGVDRTSIVDRGRFVRTKLLCQLIPDPPSGLVIPPIDADNRAKTTRQKTEMHAQGACNACHRLMDPIGAGLEQMDGIGRFRSDEFGLPVDSSGMLSGSDVDGPFTGPAELATRLLGSAQVRGCFAQQLWTYAEARPLADEDACLLQGLQQRQAGPGISLEALLLDYVQQPAFVLRRPEP